MSSYVTLGMLLKPSGLQNNLYHSQQQLQLRRMYVEFLRYGMNEVEACLSTDKKIVIVTICGEPTRLSLPQTLRSLFIGYSQL